MLSNANARGISNARFWKTMVCLMVQLKKGGKTKYLYTHKQNRNKKEQDNGKKDGHNNESNKKTRK